MQSARMRRRLSGAANLVDDIDARRVAAQGEFHLCPRGQAREIDVRRDAERHRHAGHLQCPDWPMLDNELALAGVDAFDDALASRLLGCCATTNRCVASTGAALAAPPQTMIAATKSPRVRMRENNRSASSSSTNFISASSITKATAEAAHMADIYSFGRQSVPPSSVQAMPLLSRLNQN